MAKEILPSFGLATDFYDLFGDGTIRLIFTPGHSVGHQSFLVNLLKSPPSCWRQMPHILWSVRRFFERCLNFCAYALNIFHRKVGCPKIEEF